jgi:hypothetical protein
MESPEDGDSRTAGFLLLARFLEGGRLKKVVADLEYALNSADSAEVTRVTTAAGLGGSVGKSVFEAAVLTRQQLGRLNDLVHAAGISLALPLLLEPGEELSNRPSLAAGNDPSRPFDVETDRRIMEFKFGVWQSGSNAARKRAVFHDLVHLAADQSGRRAELYLVGSQPAKFLRTTTSKVSWALNRQAEKTRELYEDRFGATDIPIPRFTGGPAAHVQLIDLGTVIPSLPTLLGS